MLNLRDSALDALVDKLTAAGIAVEKNPEWDTLEPAASPASRIPRATRSNSGSRRLNNRPES
ncbi:MAG: hypothetical protein WDN06_14735 [Asticcacaulis sp.]